MVDSAPTESCQICMRPCVRRELVAMTVSVFDTLDRIGAVDAGIIVAVEEERSLDTSCVQGLHGVVQINPWAIIER